jgi:hypothetical protein
LILITGIFSPLRNSHTLFTDASNPTINTHAVASPTIPPGGKKYAAIIYVHTGSSADALKKIKPERLILL